MRFLDLQSDLIAKFRGPISQKKLSESLGHESNRVHRWESGTTPMSWGDFVQLCEVCEVPLREALRECFGFVENPQETSLLIQHFVGKRKQSEISRDLEVSRYTLSRWLKGTQQPSLPQVLRVIFVVSAEFFRFVKILSGTTELPSIQAEMQRELAHLELFSRYPWLSALLSALDLAQYKDAPTNRFLAEKARVPLEQVEEAVAALSAQGLLHWNGSCWESKQSRIAHASGTIEQRKQIARYVYARTMDALDAAAGTSGARFSWKLFSLNRRHYDRLVQKYAEFFNELDTLIGDAQDGADKIYLFSSAFVDFDHLPVSRS